MQRETKFFAPHNVNQQINLTFAPNFITLTWKISQECPKWMAHQKSVWYMCVCLCVCMYIVHFMWQNLQNNNPPLKAHLPIACSGDSSKNGEMTQNSKSI